MPGCGVFFAKHTGSWLKTGLPLMTDQTIKSHVKEALKDWQSVNKMSSRLKLPNLSLKQKNIVKNFELRMSQTFLITDKNAEEMIVRDRKILLFLKV